MASTFSKFTEESMPTDSSDFSYRIIEDGAFFTIAKVQFIDDVPVFADFDILEATSVSALKQIIDAIQKTAFKNSSIAMEDVL